MGSDNSRGVFDNVAVQKLPPQLTLDQTTDFATDDARRSRRRHRIVDACPAAGTSGPST